MAETSLESYDTNLYRHKGFPLVKELVTPEYVDSLESFEIRDSDVFQVAYPKSGTVWMQQILSLIHFENYRNGTENSTNVDRVPWLELNLSNEDYTKRPSPRLFASHLPYYLVPRDLRNKRGKVIYIARNPKDVIASYYHFEKMTVHARTSPDFGHFMKKCLDGGVFAGSWFDHIRGWYDHSDDFNFLLITYEEMIKDLRSAVLKLCQFLGKQLNEQEVDKVVEKAKFKSMKIDPNANGISEIVLRREGGSFFRKGTIADWKNIMTVAQSEMFDKIYQEKMKNLPIKFVWDLN